MNLHDRLVLLFFVGLAVQVWMVRAGSFSCYQGDQFQWALCPPPQYSFSLGAWPPGQQQLVSYEEGVAQSEALQTGPPKGSACYRQILRWYCAIWFPLCVPTWPRPCISVCRDVQAACGDYPYALSAVNDCYHLLNTSCTLPSP